MEKTIPIIVMDALCLKNRSCERIRFGLLCLLLCLFCDSVNAQIKHDQESALLLGETVPESFWQKNMQFYRNDEYGTESLKQYKGKIIILDFWASWCTNCIESFPKLIQLQKEFPDKVVIILVNSTGNGETKEKIKHVYERQDVELKTLASITDDSLLAKLFPHRSIPSCAWINDDGAYYGISSSQMVNAESIRKLIKDSEDLETRRIKARLERKKAADEN